MEEISSLDSFHTDGGDSAVPQQESETSKLDDALSQNLNEKEDASPAASASEGDKDNADKNVGDDINSSKPETVHDDELESATNEEEFEQISDGTFEVDENSQATSSAAVAQDGLALEEKAEMDESNKDVGSDEVASKSDSNDSNSVPQISVAPTAEDFEANKSTNSNNKSSDENDESLAELNPLTSTVPEAESDVVDGGSKIEEHTAMEVDFVDQEYEGEEESVPNVDDVEMKSTPNSPLPAQIVDKNNAGNKEIPADYGRDEVDDIEQDEINQQEIVEKLRDDGIEEAADEEDESNAMDDDAEHGDDEPVENVQEPEESDVCLIPDDTETQMTEAEKEQAILARENAEKEEEKEAEAAKDDSAAKQTANLAVSNDEQEEQPDGEANANADAQANKQAGAEADATGETGEGNIYVNTNAEEGADANESEEQLAEEQEVSGSASGDAGTQTKTIITWIVSSQKTCRQCGEEKACGFRFKKPESSDEYDYLCEQLCCDAFVKENSGKFFMRRKKFLVEELLNDDIAKSTVAETETETDAADGKDKQLPAESDRAAAVGKMMICLQCKEAKQCKYFLRQDVDTFYICNDICYNLLNVEEPDKFKLKRHSIRVRNIGTTAMTASDAPAAKKNESSVVARTNVEADAARLARIDSFRRRCSECHEDVTLGDKHLVWETMDFCNEVCLGKYQRTIGSSCQTCEGEVSQTSLGKYCVRFGFDVRQFCCAACLNVYKKGLKTCSCCQKDISSGTEGFLAPVGDKEQFKDFCSQACLRRYDNMCNPKKKLRNDICGVCNNEKPVRVEMLLDDKEHYFCSNPCFSAFKFVSNVDADQCGMCCKYFERKSPNDCFTIYKERNAKVFCSRICINVYIIVNRHIVSCQWCKVKKYNFDMIYKRQDDRDVLTCSLTCLSMYGVSVKAFSRAVTKCDHCNIITTPQYHLTMSDASIRNFCTYQCVMQFQNQFARVPLTLENELSSSSSKSSGQHNTSLMSSKNGAPFPTGLPKRVKLKYSQQPQLKHAAKSSSTSSISKKSSGPVVPVISTVTSLASGETEAMIGSVTVRRGRGRGRKLDSPPPVPVSFPRGRPRKPVDYTTRSPSPIPPIVSTPIGSRRGSVTPGGSQIDYGSVQTETKIITLPPYPPTVRNVGTSSKPQTVTVGFQTAPSTREVAVQTEKDYSNKILIPVPVPIYVPQPMYMYSAPFPVPVPFPLPIPVPVFVPTTRNSAQGILKEIKKIEDRMPTDPLEAELLMMAEMVAEEKHDSDSDSDNEIKPDPGLTPMQYNNSVQQQPDVEVPSNANSYNEDVLQMALKMATGDYDQQPNTVDLESAMTANTITNPPPGMVGHDTLGEMNVHHQMDQHQMLDTQRSAGRGRKRGALTPQPTPGRNNRSPVKRPRLQDLDTPIQQTSGQHSPQQQQPTEKPDANMCLKYTFGVNAWKQWVMTKNADIEKSSLRRRTFKTELLQMTADELNYSLCLFVKEVRKPNGTEYAPDTIYYLVLGIQQYLYVNGRIDNIFYDPYYERFTECLDEVARKFSVLYNDSQYIVTRVEEEHLWECKQLGAHSPHVLLSTLMFFNTKHFNLTTVEEHMQLSFSHIMKHWKRSASQNAKMPGTRNVLLRFYPPQAGTEANPRKKKVYEQQENEENPLRCPVRLYEFYLSKCPESVKTRNDVFYLQPERSCVPDSPVWYSTQALSQDSLQRMLHRVKMVKEINIALLTS